MSVCAHWDYDSGEESSEPSDSSLALPCLLSCWHLSHWPYVAGAAVGPRQPSAWIRRPAPRGALSPLELPLRTEYRAWDVVGPTHSDSAKFRESCSICSCHHLSSLAREAEANSEKFKEKEIYHKSIGVLDRNWEVKSAFQFVCASPHSLPPSLVVCLFSLLHPNTRLCLAPRLPAGRPLASAALADPVVQHPCSVRYHPFSLWVSCWTLWRLSLAPEDVRSASMIREWGGESV